MSTGVFLSMPCTFYHVLTVGLLRLIDNCDVTLKGCQCAGPYAQRLMGLSIEKNGKYMSTAANKKILGENEMVH